MSSFFRTISKWRTRLLETLLCIVVGAMVITVCLKVTARQLGNPIAWTQEASTFLLMWCGLIGAAYTYGLKQHVGMAYISDKLEGRNRALLELLIISCVAYFSAYVMFIGGVAEVWSAADAPGRELKPASLWASLAVEGPTYTLNALNRGQMTSYLGLPVWILNTCLPISGLFIFTYCVEFYVMEVGWLLGYVDERGKQTTHAVIAPQEAAE